MNFKWQKDIYEDEDYHSQESEREEGKTVLPYPLPNIFKPIGLIIALAPVAYKIKQLYFASFFHDPFHISDLWLFLIIMCGLFIEAFSRPKIESLESQLPRLIFVGISVVTSAPFVAHLVSSLWHWFF